MYQRKAQAMSSTLNIFEIYIYRASDVTYDGEVQGQL